MIVSKVSNTCDYKSRLTGTISNSTGSDNETKNDFITVNTGAQDPIAQFGVSGSNTITTGSYVQFIDQSINNPTNWTWNFPGGYPSYSYSQNPNVQYNSPGIYDVSLTVANATGTDYEIKQGFITVNSSGGSKAIQVCCDLNFGNVAIGNYAFFEVTITNIGSENVYISGFSNPVGFIDDWNGILAPGQTASTWQYFYPQMEGYYYGEMHVNSDATNGNQDIFIDGTGIAPNFSPLVVTSGDLYYGNIPMFTQTVRYMTIKNVSNYVVTYNYDYPISACNGSGVAGTNFTLGPNQENTHHFPCTPFLYGQCYSTAIFSPNIGNPLYVYASWFGY